MGDYQWIFERTNRYIKACMGIPDRVPVTAQIHEFAMKQSGNPPSVFYTNARVFFEGMIETSRKWGLDVISQAYDSYNIEAEAVGQGIHFPEVGSPSLGRNPLIQKESDLNKIKLQNGTNSGRMPFVKEVLHLMQNEAGITPIVRFTSPFTLAVLLRGYEAFISDIYNQPSFAHEIMNHLTHEIVAPWILDQKKLFDKNVPIRGVDAAASPPLVNKSILEEFDIPYLITLRSLFESSSLEINWWGESYLKDPTEFLDLKLKMSPNMVQGQDPDVEKLGPEMYKQYAESHNVALCLGLGSRVICNSPISELIERVEKYLRIGGRGGRFVLYLCNVDSNTDPRRIDLILESVKKVSKELYSA